MINIYIKIIVLVVFIIIHLLGIGLDIFNIRMAKSEKSIRIAQEPYALL